MDAYPRAHEYLLRLHAGRVKYGNPTTAVERWIDTAVTGEGRPLEVLFVEGIEASELYKAATKGD